MDYFLHANCGYQWADRAQELTRAERSRLWKGFLLWQTAVENAGRDDHDGAGNTSSSSTQGLSSGDRKMLREMERRNDTPAP